MGGVYEIGDTKRGSSTDLGELLNVLESLEIDSKDFFEEVPIHGVVEDSGDEESSDSDDGSGDDEAGYVNGGLFLSRFVQGNIFSYNSSGSGSQSDDDSILDGYSSSELEDIGPGPNGAGYQDSQRTRTGGPKWRADPKGAMYSGVELDLTSVHSWLVIPVIHP